MKLLTGLLFCLYSVFAVAQQKGDVIIKTDFNENETPLDWSGSRKYKLVTEDGVTSLKVHGKNSLLHLYIPAEKVRGTKLYVKTRVKGEIKTPLPHPWNGVKLMLYVKQPWDEVYQQEPLPDTSFDWKENGFSILVPPAADSVSLVIGLEKIRGKAWFDNLEITVAEAARAIPSADIQHFARQKTQTKLRGAMVPTFLNEDGLRTLASWGANHIRWQLTWDGFPNSPADNATYEEYKKWLDSALNHLDKMLPLCDELGIKITLDLHTLPGGRVSGVYVHKIFNDPYWQEKLKTIWHGLAVRYKNDTTIWAYDLVNEPIEGMLPAGVMSWRELATSLAQDIRSVDSIHEIIVEGSPNGGPEALISMQPLPVQGIIYSFHMYVPGAFTHQGVITDKTGISYPGKVLKTDWNITTMRKVLQQVKDWQEQYGTRIYVGEFSAIRWTPGESTYYYLRDCISLFEEFGWDWAYHAFREYDGWSVEYSNDPKDTAPSPEITSKQSLLMEAFKLNKR